MTYKIEIIKSKRRSLVLTVKNGEVLVKAPLNYPNSKIEEFLAVKQGWIKKRLQEYEENKCVQKLTEHEIEDIREKTKNKVDSLVQEYAKIIGVNYNKITIKKMRTVWGSCSSKKNLNFNLLLSLMPENVIRYVVIHELCHLLEMNHSNRFWDKVKLYCPSYIECIGWLKKEGKNYLNKI